MGINQPNSLSDTEQKLRELNAQIKLLQEMPDQIRQEELDRQSILPPSDIVTARVKEKEFDERVNKGQITNTKKEVQRNFFILVLLVIALLSIAWWVFQSLKQNQVF
jgi:predicted nucleic acid-binding Zn ribbon protein